ncbi:unnamed protein product [Commensalibacter communis]|uniref:hypothetical protein n=1 Tax=Commensalibacter communis TaxID=2972786 RepID=UPI0022FF6F5B|nr:hypothetical protein [Commensalibacter communis]CAI3956594.1 unnamed protein product [Commensalibacter communis]CAI3957065.1 unnamed protein product [Commensalibacter communis]
MQQSTKLYRSILRDKLVEVLQKTELVEEEKVCPNFPIRVPENRLPCIYVSAPADRAEAITHGTPVFMRTATLVVQYFCSFVNVEDAAQQLDDVCYQLEDAIMCDYEFQAMIELIPSFDTDVVFNADTGKQIAEIRFVMLCKYREEFNPTGSELTQISGQII